MTVRTSVAEPASQVVEADDFAETLPDREIRQSEAVRRFPIALVLLSTVFIAYSAFFIFKTSFVFRGVRYFTLFDDMMIGMRYASNLVHHGELVWNPGERVEGFTNPLWIFYFALLHLLPVSMAKISLLVQITGVALMLATGWIVYKLAVLLSDGSHYAGLAATALTLFYYPLTNWALQGCEVSLLAFLLTLAVWQFLKASQTGSFTVWPYLLMGFAVLTRIDAAVPLVALLSYALITDRKRARRHLTLGLGILVLALGSQTVARRLYYGDIVPNTYYQKISGTPFLLRLERGWVSFARFILQVNPILILLAGSTLFTRKRVQIALPLSIVMFQLAYSTAVGGDAWEKFGGTNRYLSIAIPLFFAVLGCALRSLTDFITGVPGHWRASWSPFWKVAAVACAVVTLNVGGDTENAKQWALAELPPDVELLQQHAKAGLLIPAFTQPDAKIAVVWAGVLPYFAERPAIDLLGKCDKVIAREPIKSVPGQVFRPGHMKWDYEYSISHFHPDMIVELWRAPEQAADILRREHYREMYLTGLKIYVRTDSDKIDWRALEKAMADPTSAIRVNRTAAELQPQIGPTRTS